MSHMENVSIRIYKVYYNHFTRFYGEEYAEFFRMTCCFQEEMAVV